MTARPLALLLASAALLGACTPAARRTRDAATAPAGAIPAASPVETGALPFGTAADFDTLLVDVATIAPGLRVDLRYAGPGNFTGATLPGYEGNRALLRREAATALAAVQRDLADSGLTLLVWDAYRPVRATDAMMAWTERTGRTDLVRDGYIASRSRHNLGVAVDLTLADAATGAPLDMGTPFDTFSREAHTANASGAVARNRARLVQAMQRRGFESYAEEWWHFSFAVERPLRFDVPIR